MEVANSTQKKVSFFIPAIERGGVERNLINLSKGFLSHGYAVDVIFSRGGPTFIDQLPKEVCLIRLISESFDQRAWWFTKGRAGISLVSMGGLWSYLREARPTALIAMQSSSLAVWVWLLAGKPSRLIVRESNTPSAALRHRNISTLAALLMKRLSYLKADAIVANSQGAATDLARLLHTAQSSVRVIYNPTYDSTIVTRSKQSVDHPWFQSRDVPVILSIGRLVDQKDFKTLLRAFALLREQGVRARLVILGEGYQRASLENLARELKVENDLALPGFVTNPYAYLSRATLFALSSLYEGLPNVLIEAAGLNIPIVAMDCPSGPREILLEGRAGLLVTPGDVDGLAHAMKVLIQDQTLAAQLVHEGEKYLYRFTPQAGVSQYIDLINEIGRRKGDEMQ